MCDTNHKEIDDNTPQKTLNKPIKDVSLKKWQDNNITNEENANKQK
jgi:hypothetical protein